jgi:hypothetical protein
VGAARNHHKEIDSVRMISLWRRATRNPGQGRVILAVGRQQEITKGR